MPGIRRTAGRHRRMILPPGVVDVSVQLAVPPLSDPVVQLAVPSLIVTVPVGAAPEPLAAATLTATE